VIIDLIREVVPLLSRDTLGVEDVTARIGPVIRDPGIPMPLEMQPPIGMRSASLSRYPDTGIPYVLTIVPEPEGRPTVAELKAILGDYRRALTDRGQAATMVFSPAMVTPRWSVAVIVKLERSDGPVETRSVTTIALRRDPKNQSD